VTQTHSGTWVLSGAKQYTGGTTSLEGALLIDGLLVAGDPVTPFPTRVRRTSYCATTASLV
jgi:autotransporter-associated beta strand protein